MNTKIFNAIALLFLVGSVACHQTTIEKLQTIKDQQFQSDLVGQSVIDTIQLQLTTGGSVDTVIRLLEGLNSDLLKQQAASDAEHVAKNIVWAALIKNYNKVIDGLKLRIGEIEQQISVSHKKIQETERSIKINKQQIALVTKKIEDLSAARKADKDATSKRVTRQEEMLKAINYIIAELQKMLAAQSFVQLGQIKEKLQKLVKENPIEALVQLTMTFQPNSVNFAVKKLAQIRDSIVASLKDEAEQEAHAKQQFHQLKDELVAFNGVAHVALDLNRAKLAALQTQLANQEKDLKQTKALKVNNEALLAQTIKTRDNYNNQYSDDKKQRSSEEATLKQVIGILEENTGRINKSEANKFTSGLSK